jgi:hypothetical protein
MVQGGLKEAIRVVCETSLNEKAILTYIDSLIAEKFVMAWQSFRSMFIQGPETV